MSRKLHFVQVLRATAAMLVVASHVIHYIALKNDVDLFYRNIAGFTGAFGVDLFFVISGFIMIYTSKNLFQVKGGALKFASRRILRIVPLYWLATFVAMLLVAMHQFPSPAEIATSFLFIPFVNDPGQPLRPILGVGWTLNLEMFFYALFAAALLFRRLPGTYLLIATMTSLVALGTLLKPLSDRTEPETAATFLTSPILLLFAAGVVLGLLIDHPRRSTIRFPAAGYASLALTALAVVLFMTQVDRWPIPLGWQLLFWGLAVAIIALAVVAPVPKDSAALRGLEFLGDASYSIYLFHFLITAAFGRIWQLLLGRIDTLSFYMTAFLVACAGGALIHLWVERPLIRRLQHLPLSPGARPVLLPKR